MSAEVPEITKHYDNLKQIDDDLDKLNEEIRHIMEKESDMQYYYDYTTEVHYESLSVEIDMLSDVSGFYAEPFLKAGMRIVLIMNVYGHTKVMIGRK